MNASGSTSDMRKSVQKSALSSDRRTASVTHVCVGV